MDGSELHARIDTWHAAGVIDTGTADRIWSYEQARSDREGGGPFRAAGSARGSGATVAVIFGPALSIAEVFGYVGTVFLLAAWHVFVSTGADGPDPGTMLVEFGMPAAALFAIGIALRSRDAAGSRAAGVAFLLSVGYAATATYATLDTAMPDADSHVLLAASAAVGALTALVARRLHPSVLTQLGLVSSALVFAAAVLSVIDDRLFPPPDYTLDEEPLPDPAVAVVRAAGTAAWWLVWAAGLGALARFESASSREARAAGDPVGAEAAGRRDGFSRFFAGLVAVGGTFSAVTQASSDGRVVPAWMGDAIVLGVAGCLLALAVLRGSSAYLVPAAIGIIAALTDANATYIATDAGFAGALLVEGLILLGAGGVAVAARRGHGSATLPPGQLDTGSITG
jgi:hypothetical protein